MNYDIAMCCNKSCNRKHTCKRYQTYLHLMRDSDAYRPVMVAVTDGCTTTGYELYWNNNETYRIWK